ncbi:MAG TPA: helix-turn-helix domain-containing protein [Allosphingosinicella sp.]|jgi:AcrR family transcriptional regulator
MSTTTAQTRASKARPYRLGRRAGKQGETRRRIVEAAVELHSSLGPARTTVARIAERAGVQRHTYYAHFPEERDLFLACSGLALERDPLPDPEAWRALPPGRERLSRGLADLYGWYARNARMAACVLRDAEHHELTREMAALRIAPVLERGAVLLGEGLGMRARALLAVALDFHCWRAVSGACGPEAAADLMSDAILALNPSVEG